MLHKDRVALVTGAAMGIGRATALAFAREGAKVVVADINEPEGEKVVAEIRNGGGDALFVRADVTSSSDVQAMVAATVRRYGRLDSAFNNAGALGPTGSVTEISERDWDAMVALNMTSVFLCLKHEIPVMLERGGGAIVNTSSGMGLFANPRVAAYVATKHAVIGLTKSAAIDFGSKNIRVNALLPGKTLTELTKISYQRLGLDLDEVAGTLPLHRLGLPQDQAEAVVWLCSDRSSFITGMSLIVDGGQAAQR